MSDAEFWLWMIAAFVVGRVLPRRIYIGPDEEKYKAADFAILTNRKR